MADDVDFRTVTAAAAARARDGRAHRLFLVFAGLALAGVVALCFGLLSVKSQADELAHQQAYAAGVAQQLAGQIRGLGVTPKVNPPSAVEGNAGTPDTAPEKVTAPSQAQIDDSVNRYLAAHPPAGATPAMVAAQVAAYLVANPPAAGQNATPAQIAAAVSTYVDAHPDEFRGPAGADATDAQVSATVDAYCSAHNNCAGPAGADGKQGDQGVGMSDLQFVRDDAGDCQVVVTLHDPSTGSDSTVTHPAGDAACPPATPPPTTTTTTTDPLLPIGG